MRRQARHLAGPVPTLRRSTAYRKDTTVTDADIRRDYTHEQVKALVKAVRSVVRDRSVHGSFTLQHMASVVQTFELDPEQVLIDKVNAIRLGIRGPMATTPEIIAAVREHDRAHR